MNFVSLCFNVQLDNYRLIFQQLTEKYEMHVSYNTIIH